MSLHARAARVLLALAAAVVMVLHAGHWRAGWTDDAFITFRYARNFAAGRGMVFNEGESVEGITNLGWALLLTPFANGDLLLTAQLLGVGFSVATVFVLAAWAHREKLGLAATAILLGSFVVVPWAPYWAMQGLETSIVMLLCTLAWTRYRADATSTRGPLLSGPAMALAPWFRPDEALTAIIVGGWHLWTRGLPRTRRLLLSVGVVVVSAVVLVGLKLAWYGEILPNTFHVKVDKFPPDRGFNYLTSFLSLPNIALPAMVLLACAWGFRQAARKDDRALPSLLFVAYLVAVVLQNGDFFPNFRLLVPVWPAACAAMALAAQALGDAVATRSAFVGKLVPLGALAAVSAPVLAAARIDSVERLDADDGPKMGPGKTAALLTPWENRSWNGGPKDMMPFPSAWALVNVGPGDTVAYSELGLISFIQEGPVLDMLGLTDPVIAGRNGEDWKVQVAYLEGRAGAMVINVGAGLWPRWRSVLAEGWKPEAACDHNWVFTNPDRPLTPPDAAELDRRLALALERAPRMAGLHLSIGRELSAAGASPDRIDAWFDTVEALGTIDATLITRARCDAGLGEGCTARPTCERGTVRSTGADLGAPERWPGWREEVAPPTPQEVGGAAALVGPNGQPLAGAPLPDAEAEAAPKLPEGCDEARRDAADAWEALGTRWRGIPALDEARRAAREVARAARSGSADLQNRADAMADVLPAVHAGAPETEKALGEARQLAKAAIEACK